MYYKKDVLYLNTENDLLTHLGHYLGYYFIFTYEMTT